MDCSWGRLNSFLSENYDLKGRYINGGIRYKDVLACCKALEWFDFPKKTNEFSLQAGTVRRVLYDRFGLHVSFDLLRISAAFLGVPFLACGSRFEFFLPMPLNRSAEVYLDEFFIRESKVRTKWKG